eukprot:TRINITY_DN22312_c0_g1_i1.p1 TRINITY_DN22312_c0_g1~~TRINITY_DN22312_c0_g1_i1.p1  ORF type:complete len:224 (-),score=39.00 TRINITY_DN22312_c0_g1_i1:200-871(-)
MEHLVAAFIRASFAFHFVLNVVPEVVQASKYAQQYSLLDEQETSSLYTEACDQGPFQHKEADEVQPEEQTKPDSHDAKQEEQPEEREEKRTVSLQKWYDLKKYFDDLASSLAISQVAADDNVDDSAGDDARETVAKVMPPGEQDQVRALFALASSVQAIKETLSKDKIEIKYSLDFKPAILQQWKTESEKIDSVLLSVHGKDMTPYDDMFAKLKEIRTTHAIR